MTRSTPPRLAPSALADPPPPGEGAHAARPARIFIAFVWHPPIALPLGFTRAPSMPSFGSHSRQERGEMERRWRNILQCGRALRHARLPALHRGDCPRVPCGGFVRTSGRQVHGVRPRFSLILDYFLLPANGICPFQGEYLSGEGPTTNVSQLLAGDRSIPRRSPDTARTGADEAHRAGAALAFAPGPLGRISARASRLLHQTSVTG